MARLNEIPQPAGESIEALKRRFVRQNRELARVNSTQSIRIRNLECEFSNLQSENVSLRGQNIKLQNELENSADRSAFEKINHVRLKLEALLVELGGVMERQESAGVHRSQRRKSGTGNTLMSSPNERRCKNTLLPSEVSGENHGRLPPILEDKYYPRRTIDAEDLPAIISDPVDSIESPDLGPPPVAHFDESDPIKFDAKQDQSDAKEELENLQQQMLSANLETRKKRRENPHQREYNRREGSTGVKNQTLPFEKPSGQILKSGAKRKLTARGCAENLKAESDKDEHYCNRTDLEPGTGTAKSSNVPSISRDKMAYASETEIQDANTSIRDSSGKDQAKKQDVNITSGGRRPLGSKSVNSNPKSPTKVNLGNNKDRHAESKYDAVNRHREQNRAKRPAGAFPPKFINVSDDQHAMSVEEPPETPVPLGDDLISPQSSEPSARAKLCDTPPPPDLGQDTGNNSFGRASRRPRGSVNYAQPNLRDKMRRPTRELVDAVGAEARTHQPDDYTVEGSINIKHEEDQEALSVWRANPFETATEQTPLPVEEGRIARGIEGKASLPSADLPSSVITDRKRGTSTMTLHAAESDPDKHSSGASSTIAALTSGNRKARMREDHCMSSASQEDRIIGGIIERADVYDFTSSSPGDTIDGTKESGEQEERAKPVRFSRRHSTVATASDQGKGLLSISRDHLERRRGSVSASSESRRKERDVTSKLKSVKSVMALASDLEAIPVGGERATSRRRSMML